MFPPGFVKPITRFSIRPWQRSALLLVLPTVITAVLVLVIFHRWFLDFAPTGTDEIDYYLEILAVHSHALQFGHFAENERTAILAFKQFGIHGPMFPLIYGAISWCIGWGFSTAVLLNAIVIGFSLAVFERIVKPHRREFLLFLGLVAGFYPLWLYVPSIFEEPLNLSLVILLSALLIRIYSNTLTPRLRYAYFVLMVIMVGMRPTFAVFFLVPMIKFSRRENIVAAALLILSIAFDLLSWGLFSKLLLSTNGLPATAGASSTFWSHAINQLPNLVLPYNSQGLEIAQRYEALVIFGSAIIMIILDAKVSRVRQIPPLFHVVNLGSLLVSLLLIWDVFDWRDYRAIAPHLLLSLLLLIFSGSSRRLLWIVVGCNAALAVSFLLSYKYLHTTEYLASTSGIEQFGTEVGSHLHYTPGADNWDNTLLYVSDGYRDFRQFAALPAGIGLSFSMIPQGLKLPPRSKYILIDSARLAEWQGRVELRSLVATTWGLLGENASRSH